MNRNNNSRKSEKHIEVLIIVLFAVIALAVGVVVVAKNFSPAVPDVDHSLSFDTHPADTETDEEGNAVNPENAAKYVRKEGVYNFLFVGYDKAAGLTDVNILGQFDTNTGAINLVQIPRDTYARYNESGYYKKINGAVSYYKKDLDLFADFLEKNLCIKIDYYGSIDLVAFRNIVDIIGGVEIDIPADMDYEDPEQDLYIHLKAGFQTLNGEQAEQFVRFRKGYVQADIGRTNAQKLFMTAFLKKFKSSVSVSTLTQVGTQMLKYADTNLTLNEYVYFATKVLSIDLDKLNMMTLPGQDVRENGSSGAWYYVLSRSSMLDAVNKYLNVYEKDITDSIFDPNMMFTNPASDYMLKIYYTDADTTVYVGDDMDSNGIYIPRTKSTSASVTDPTEDNASDILPDEEDGVPETPTDAE
ncbi:MAG: LCP family protein [Eubacteriales bacterium]